MEDETPNDAETDTENDPDTLVERIEAGIERAVANRDMDDVTASADVVRRDTGVRLRTNVQAGSASERAEVTLEQNAESLADLVANLDTHRKVISDELAAAAQDARGISRGDE